MQYYVKKHKAEALSVGAVVDLLYFRTRVTRCIANILFVSVVFEQFKLVDVAVPTIWTFASNFLCLGLKRINIKG